MDDAVKLADLAAQLADQSQQGEEGERAEASAEHLLCRQK